MRYPSINGDERSVPCNRCGFTRSVGRRRLDTVSPAEAPPSWNQSNHLVPSRVSNVSKPIAVPEILTTERGPLRLPTYPMMGRHTHSTGPLEPSAENAQEEGDEYPCYSLNRFCVAGRRRSRGGRKCPSYNDQSIGLKCRLPQFARPSLPYMPLAPSYPKTPTPAFSLLTGVAVNL
jgi:hypothetical protein